MNFLVVASRFPWPPYTGDRLRTIIWLDALRAAGRVTLAAPPGKLPPSHEDVVHIPVGRSVRELAREVVRVVRERLPAHALIAGGSGWREAIARATPAEGFDATVVLLSRLEPWAAPARPRTTQLAAPSS